MKLFVNALFLTILSASTCFLAWGAPSADCATIVAGKVENFHKPTKEEASSFVLGARWQGTLRTAIGSFVLTASSTELEEKLAKLPGEEVSIKAYLNSTPEGKPFLVVTEVLPRKLHIFGGEPGRHIFGGEPGYPGQ